MAISRLCSCKCCYSIQLLACPSCGRTATKFKVRVKLPLDEKWLTKSTDTHEDAQRVEDAFRKQADAQKLMRKVAKRATSHNPKVASQSPITLDQAWLFYLPYIEDRNRSWKDDLFRYNKHIKPVIGSKAMIDIRPLDVLRCIPSRSLSPATRHRILTLIKRLFNWSIKFDLYQGVNPCCKVEPPRYDNSRHRYLNSDEKDRLLKALADDEDQYAVRLIKFLLLTGRRRGEVLSLEWSDIDMDKALVTFRKTKNGKIQTVPVNDYAMAVIREAWFDTQNGRCGSVGKSGVHSKAFGHSHSKLVFPCSTGKRFWSFNKGWKRIRTRAELKDFRLHDLRHTFASTLASSGKVDIYTLQRLLGHSQITMTQRYAHLMPGALKDAVDVMTL